jgi:hypothetical protein
MTVGATPLQIDGIHTNPTRIHIHNNDNSTDLLIGGADLTVSNGLKLPKLDSVELILNPGEVLFALSSSGTIDLSWLVQTV